MFIDDIGRHVCGGPILTVCCIVCLAVFFLWGFQGRIRLLVGTIWLPVMLLAVGSFVFIQLLFLSDQDIITGHDDYNGDDKLREPVNNIIKQIGEKVR